MGNEACVDTHDSHEWTQNIIQLDEQGCAHGRNRYHRKENHVR
jgi:hypothetical protein